MVEDFITKAYLKAFKSVYNQDIETNSVQVQKTKSDFEGDLTCVVFPHLRWSKQSPEQTANAIGDFLKDNYEEIKATNSVKGFLNITLSDIFWLNALNDFCSKEHYRLPPKNNRLMVEYSSPNTNKPLHLGHIRNNFLGYAVANLLSKTGHEVIKTQIINDRGIHICKSMLAWMKWGANKTPEEEGIKGDHFVGKYYVEFEKNHKREVAELIESGKTKELAVQESPLFIEAQNLLLKWEQGDAEVVKLWEEMNNWVYQGFESTYQKMGVDFDVLYYESETYKLGKEIVQEGLEKGVFYQREDGSVWCDLTDDGLDEKLVLRKDGTAVYMTQDIGTAIKRYQEHKINGIIYTVGNEQEYHFKVLFLILKKLGYDFHEGLYHLSYGMVELPNGRMKTREGTVVDADDLMDEMVKTAALANEEKGKLEGLSDQDIAEINTKVGMSALKYFILKVDPRKGMVFNPEDSIDFNGNTGPFILFNYVRTRSILRNFGSSDLSFSIEKISMNELEKELSMKLLDYFQVLENAANEISPAIVANYVYDLAKTYSQYYASTQILKETNQDLLKFRVYLSKCIGDIIKDANAILGIQMPERM